jgi:hypothetical protein
MGYAARGWPLFPCHTPLPAGGCSCRTPTCTNIGKHPRTKHGLKDAATDPRQLRWWWRQWPDANIGLATGAASGLVVLDIDPRHGGDATLAALETRYAPLPDTVEALTGSGGRHVCFAHPGGQVPSRHGFAPGLDFKADGGYVVVAPSLHASGRRYAWELAHHPADTALAPMPAWLIALVQESARPGGTQAPVDGPLVEGVRNETLFKLACAMRRHGAPPEAIGAALEITNAQRCAPPLGADEVQRIAASAMRYAAQPPRGGPGTDRDYYDGWLGWRSQWHGFSTDYEIVGGTT